MWTTVLVLALALNLEPNRLAIIGFLLIRPHPIRQLVVFLVCSVVTAASAGLLLLSLMHHGSILQSASSGAKVQIAIGAVALAAAAVLFGTVLFQRRGQSGGEPVPTTSLADNPDSTGNARLDKFIAGLSGRSAKLVNGSSPVLAIILGVGNALPSVDFMALLLLIATSGLSTRMEVITLFTFLAITNAVLLFPIFSYAFAKERTLRFLQGLRTWVLARSRRDVAALLAIIGVAMTAIGFSRL